MLILFITLLVVSGCGKETYTENPNAPESFNKEEYKVEVEEMPMPVGGITAIQERVVYPADAKEAGIEGKVFVVAFIDESGDVIKAEVIKSVHPSLDSAAVQAVRQVKFEPGKSNGKKVKVQITVPIMFKLQ